MNKTERDPKKSAGSSHPDPLTGESGMHPIGTGIGALAGGATAGAAVGTGAGPVGTIAGAAIGAVVGGLVGKGIAEAVNPTVEEAYWRDNHGAQPYTKGRDYDDYRPAYASGYEGYARYGSKGTSFETNEADLRKSYESNRPKLSWEDARPASQAAWQRMADQDNKDD